MRQDIDLLIVNPGARAQMYGKLASTLAGLEPPLWCALIAAFVRQQGYSVAVIDADVENWSPKYTASKIAEYNPRLVDIVVLGCNPSASSTPKMTAVREVLLALKAKLPQAKTMLSGLHPSALPERTLREEAADFVCQGEGFYTTLKLLEALKSGKEASYGDVPGLWLNKDGQNITNPLAPLVNPDDLPMAAWDLLPMDKYRAHNWHCFGYPEHQREPYGVVYTSIGCPFDCSYCNIHAFYNGKPGIRFRSPKKVVEEIDFLVKTYKIRNFKFIDELFALQEDHVNDICDLLIDGGHDLNIWAYARADTINEKMANKMKEAGINWLCFGFESASQEVRAGVAKKYGQAKMEAAIRITQAAGIHIIANFMFGLPDDDRETMKATLDTAKYFNFEYVNFYTVMAYPGSKLYDDAVRQGIELPKRWHGFGQFSEESLSLPTKYVSGAEVLRFRDKAFVEYFSNPQYLNMIERTFGSPTVEQIKGMLGHKITRKYA